MRVVVQKALNAECIVDGKVVGKIANGYMLLVGFTNGDSFKNVEAMARKVKNLRIFADSEDKMNLSLADVNGSILSISQFSLYASTVNGNRPSFINVLPATDARKLYLEFNNCLRELGVNVEEGIFQEHMKIAFINDGPITIILEN